ncbi:MAG TPA: SRPBCC family protein [Parafilimonas sp.]|nr:SRPBCC family protein [Parafilimonas sp.]
MPVIRLTTHILSDIETCFDLARSIDLHQISTAHTNEKAIAGITKGLINLNEQVTWRAKHFGITRQLTSKITAFDRPFYFRDEQVKGAFKYIIHDHSFKTCNGVVVMRDVFSFQSPYGVWGRLADKFMLTGYLTRLLAKRNDVIKCFAETGQWKTILTV